MENVLDHKEKEGKHSIFMKALRFIGKVGEIYCLIVGLIVSIIFFLMSIFGGSFSININFGNWEHLKNIINQIF